jgi:branched-chain amino acid transport system permease protein
VVDHVVGAETAAGVMGVNVPRYKLATRVVSAMMAGLAGCLSAHVSSFIGPNEYGFETATTILSYAWLGEIGMPFGPVVGAAILTLLPEVLRFLADYRLMINGAIIVIAVMFMPRDLLSRRMKRTV